MHCAACAEIDDVERRPQRELYCRDAHEAVERDVQVRRLIALFDDGLRVLLRRIRRQWDAAVAEQRLFPPGQRREQ